MNLIRNALLLLPVLCASLLGEEAKPIAAGKSHFVFSAGGKELDVFAHRPETFTNGPLLIVMHGMNRNAETYRDNTITLGNRLNALVIAPNFDLEQFPVEAYQRGGVTLDGEVQPKETWTFAIIPKLVAEVRRREGREAMPYFLIGHSAGGQFLTRLAAFLPGDAAGIVAGNPGSQVFPSRDMPFQYGFGKLPPELSDDNALKRYLSAPLTLLLGTEDTGSKDLDVSTIAMKQGATRIERGRACYVMAEELARAKGWPFNWRKIEVPGIGHSSANLFDDPLTLGAFEAR